MGKAITELAPEHSIDISAPIGKEDSPNTAIDGCEGVIDVSLHFATLPLVELCAERKKPIVIGTTGHSASETEAIQKLSTEIPILWAGNFSVIVNLLNYLTQKAAHILTEDYHAEVIEMHHGLKVDAPSGTAKELINSIEKARGLSEAHERYGRKGITGKRPEAEIGVHSLRGGDIVGEHTVIFAGQGERLELTQRATDRKIFARGALRALLWLLKEKPGLYGMADVLGLPKNA